MIAITETEAGFTRAALDLAKLHGWKSLHLRPARTKDGWRTPIQGDGKGWPDLFLVRGRRLVALELKVKSKLTAEQNEWLDALGLAGVEAYVARPADWSKIEELLK